MSLVGGATACSGVIIQFTVPQVIKLSRSSGNPLPQKTSARHMTALLWRSIAPQTAITAVQFGLVRQCKIGLDSAMGEHPLHLSLAYGAVSMPFVAAKYNLLITDVYKYHGRIIEDPVQQGPIQRAVSYWNRNVAPGIVWSLLRDSLSVGGAIVLAPTVAPFVAQLQHRLLTPGQGETQNPTRSQEFVAGVLSGALCGLGTQLFHNAALTAGRMKMAPQPRRRQAT